MRSRRPLKSRRTYTPGELNKLVDAFMHPLAKTNPDVLILDGILHGIIEHNPTESAMKFIQHNLPKLLPQLMRAQRATGRRPRAPGS